jgi:uncharacterized membrane protein
MENAQKPSHPLFLCMLFFFSLCIPLSSAFTIDSYYSEAWVLPNGDLAVYEDMVFTLERQYSEGYRSIRPADYRGDIGNVVLHGATLNGNPVPAHTQTNGENAEIVWERTAAGKNKVQLNYTLKNMAESYNDFAKICFEHYGANWEVPARSFQSVMHLPESTRGTEMHFEVYSEKQGTASVEGLAIVIELDGVPPGNYIGGCYLFNNSAVSAQKHVNASALQILQDEREIYGSTDVSSSDTLVPPLCCPPIALALLAVCAYLLYTYKAPQKLPESIFPPSREHPAAVSVLLRARYDEKEILASTILNLINKGVLDIMELEKEGSQHSMELKRERTILFLKKRPKTPMAEEQIILDMIFAEGEKEVDLDALAEKWKKISTKSEAKESIIPKKMDEFSRELKSVIKEKGLYKYQKSQANRLGASLSLSMFIGFFFLCSAVDLLFSFPETLPSMLEEGRTMEAALIIAGFAGTLLLFPLSVYLYMRPPHPKGREGEYSKWDAFRRAVNASSLKEEPPSASLIWGEILVYATALGIAKKVEKHLSELDTLLASRIQKMERVRLSSIVLYSSAIGVRNLSKYGNRSGFSRSSSGGWSSGGGGFSGGHSGGGGFR